MDGEEALATYRAHVDMFSSRLKEASAELLLSHEAVARMATDARGFTFDRRRVGEWMRGKQIPTSEAEVRALEQVLQLPEDYLFSEWKVAAVARRHLGRRRLPVSDVSTGPSEELSEVTRPTTGNSPELALAVRRRLDGFLRRLDTTIRLVPDRWAETVASLIIEPFLDSAADPFLADLDKASVGAIRLGPDDYYDTILEEMEQAGRGSRVIAVSTLASKLWEGDPDQLRYVELNCKAANQGAHIDRLFIVPKGNAAAFRNVIERQLEAAINVRVADPQVISEVPELEDFVAFSDSRGRRAYSARPAIDGSKRVLSGTLVLSEHQIGALESAFRKAWRLSEPAVRKAPSVKDPSPQQLSTQAPGDRLVVRTLKREVTTCEEAARERGISLTNELKTLIVSSSSGLVAVHLRGDRRVDLRKVKTHLEAEQARLADPEELANIGLSPGTVCAVLEPVWSMRHLVSRSLLSIDEVMTNNGTKTGYFAFSPSLLLDASQFQVGDFDAAGP